MSKYLTLFYIFCLSCCSNPYAHQDFVSFYVLKKDVEMYDQEIGTLFFSLSDFDIIKDTLSDDEIKILENIIDTDSLHIKHSDLATCHISSLFKYYDKLIISVCNGSQLVICSKDRKKSILLTDEGYERFISLIQSMYSI